MPADRLGIDLVVECMTGCLEGKKAAAIKSGFGIKVCSGPFCEPGRPMADRHELKPTIVFQLLDLRA